MSFLASPLGMLIVFGITLAVIMLATGGGDTKKMKKRLDRVTGKARLQKMLEEREKAVVDITGRKKTRFEEIFGRFIPRPEKLTQRIRRSGKDLTPGKYLIICVVVGVVATFLAHFSVKQSWGVSLCAGLALGLAMPHWYLNRGIAKRNKQFLSSFPDAIDLVVRGIRSGLPIGESIRTIATEMRGPIGEEFSTVNDGMKFGQPVEVALMDCSNRMDLPEIKFFVIALSIQKETGGNLAETLENLSTIIRKRSYMRLKIKAMSSEARASAMIIGSLPFAMFFILLLMSPKYIDPLLSDPRGHRLIFIGLVLIAIGNFIMRKIAQFKI